jgi:hypothetical protein
MVNPKKVKSKYETKDMTMDKLLRILEVRDLEINDLNTKIKGLETRIDNTNVVLKAFRGLLNPTF